MKKKLSVVLLALTLSVCMYSNTVCAAFADVYENDWHCEAVQYVSENGIMTGLDDTTFGVNEPLKRAQFALILYRLAGEPEVAFDDRFPDIAQEDWYADAVLWANGQGIVTGYTDTGLFDPSKDISREEMVTMLYRYEGFPQVSADLSKYPDAGLVGGWSMPGMQWAVACGIISGDNGLLNPLEITNREVAAMILMRYMKLGTEEEETVTKGDRIVEYARTLIGTPYRYGGTDINTGVDCSYFVQYVFKQFGINLPRTTYEQEKVGYEVSYADAKPGDLILYNGHVGIYSGNHMIVHASLSQGKVVEADCRHVGTIITVRRVW